MNTGTRPTNDPHDNWLEWIEQQLRQQDEAFEQAANALEGLEPISLGIPGEVLEELREACLPRKAPATAPVFATRC